MRMVAVCHEYPPLGTGAANALAHLAPRWAAAGVETTLVTSQWADLPAVEEEGGLRIEKVECGRQRRLGPSALELVRFLRAAQRALPATLARARPDVVLAFFTIPAGAAVRKACRSAGIPYVVALRGSDVPGYDPRRFGGLLSWMKPWTRSIWRGAAQVVANSSWLAALAKQTAPQQAIGVVPNGVEAEYFAPPAPRTFSAAGPLRILFVGQLIPRKQVDRLIAAVQQLGSDATLDIVGDGKERSQLEQLVRKLALTERVRFHGARLRAEVRDHLWQADVLAMPTEAEGMSNVLLEALAAGLPVLTTPAGAADLIDHGRTGLVAEGSVTGIVAGLNKLQDPELRQAISRAAIEEAGRRTWDRIAEAWLEVLRAAARSSAA